MHAIFKACAVTLWALCGIILLPCVFIAGTIFPVWVEWGEDF